MSKNIYIIYIVIFSMTKRLEHAFQKATQELSETERDLLAKFLLQ